MPAKLVRLLVTLTPQALAAIDAARGTRSRAEAIEEAVRAWKPVKAQEVRWEERAKQGRPEVRK